MKVTNPKRAAIEVLEEYWPGQSLPVDPIRIATAMGIDVRIGSLPDNCSGAIIKRAGSDPIILLESGDHRNRQRFTCAHELGHYLRNAGDDSFEYVDLRGPLASSGINDEEVFANRFAANLLMPEDIVREQVSHGLPLWLLAKQFSVSAEAMRFRLKNLNLPFDE